MPCYVLCLLSPYEPDSLLRHTQSDPNAKNVYTANLIKFNDGNKKGPTNTNRHYSHHTNVYASSTIIECGEGRFLTHSFISHIALLLWPKECWRITLYSCVGLLMKYYWRNIHHTHTITFFCFVWVSWHLLVLCWSTVVFSNNFFSDFSEKIYSAIVIY